MSGSAIEVYALGKLFRKDGSGLMRAVLDNAVRRPFGAKRREARDPNGEDSALLWALRDVSFEVRWGECVGLVGGNGAGKSVLLKILSRITKPTEGVARIRGRVGSMLEVGTGFHRELSGRENIALAGAMFGMTRRDVARRFDEIVDFSGVGHLLDMPLKHYSSGMSLRLAFAVAAHLDTDVMLLDEVFAVGDEAFARQCTERLRLFRDEGGVVVLVSHDHRLVESLCGRVLRLERGRLTADGPTDVVLGRVRA